MQRLCVKVYYVKGSNAERTGNMIKVFANSDEASAHDKFQAWRAEHQDGVFLTLQTQTRANLHGARCLHLGSPPYFSSNAGFGSLTSTKKVCAPQSELLA